MTDNYNKDFPCDKYCGKPDAGSAVGYHWGSCPNHPKNSNAMKELQCWSTQNHVKNCMKCQKELIQAEIKEEVNDIEIDSQIKAAQEEKLGL